MTTARPRHRVQRCGKVIVASSDEELPHLDELRQRALANGVEIEEVGRERLAELEPHVAGVRALHAPAMGIVDFRRVVRALADDVRSAGGHVRTGREVTGCAPTRTALVESGGDEIRARFVVTCAGLYSDRLAMMTGGPASPKIVPSAAATRAAARGAGARARPRLPGAGPGLPVPRRPLHEAGLRGGLGRAERVLAFAREGYRLRDVRLRDLRETLAYRGFQALTLKYWRAGLAEATVELSKRRFVAALRKLVPDLGAEDLLPGPSGVRAQALSEDGQLLDDFWSRPRPARRRVSRSRGRSSTASSGRSRPDTCGKARRLTPALTSASRPAGTKVSPSRWRFRPLGRLTFGFRLRSSGPVST
jgi:(S)-2-hydroxyglutarate dehydrogenase